MPYDSTTGAPQWVQPSSESSKELRDSCVFRFQLALRTAGLEMASDASAQVQSGEALRIRSRDFESRAKRFANNMTRYENAVLGLIALLSGVSEKPTATYPKRFTLPDSVEDLANALALLDPSKMPLEIGPDGKIAAAKQALGAALSLSDAETASIIDWIRNHLGDEVADMGQARAIDVAMRDQKLAELTPAEVVEAPTTDPAMPDPQAKDPSAALNGAQVSSLLEIVNQVGSRQIPRETGIGLIVAAFPLSSDQAEALMGEVGATFFAALPGEMPAPPPPPKVPDATAVTVGTLDTRSAA